MQRLKKLRSATHVISVVLLSGAAITASADQMMLKKPAPTAATPTAAKAAVQLPAINTPAPGASPKPVPAPAPTPMPDLTFSTVSVNNINYPFGSAPQSLVVNRTVIQTSSSGANKMPNLCGHPYTFPVRFVVQNIGNGEFVDTPKGIILFQAVELRISDQSGNFNVGGVEQAHANEIGVLQPKATQTMNTSLSLPPGKYFLYGDIIVHHDVSGVKESRTDNNTFKWPLEVKCEVKAATMIVPAVPSGASTPVGGGVKKKPLAPILLN